MTLESDIKQYLTSEKISLDEKKLLFALQTRAVNVKTNYSGSYTKSTMQCRLCRKNGEDESEIHIMKCSQIISENNLKTELENIAYLDIFGTLEKQISAVKVWKKVFRVWNLKLESSKLFPSGHQVHQPQGQSASLPCTSSQSVDPPSPDVDSNCIVYDFG